jgi:hypothetical protein
MPGDWLMYRHLEDRQKCPECDQRMELVKTVSFVGAIASENKEVFRCNNCHKDVEQTPVLNGLIPALKFTWKVIRITKNWGL